MKAHHSESKSSNVPVKPSVKEDPAPTNPFPTIREPLQGAKVQLQGAIQEDLSTSLR